MKQRNNNNDKLEIARALALFTQLGINMAICIMLSLFLGNFIDKHFNTYPLFLIIFLILGILASIRNMYYMVMKDKNNQQSGEDNE